MIGKIIQMFQTTNQPIIDGYIPFLVIMTINNGIYIYVLYNINGIFNGISSTIK